MSAKRTTLLLVLTVCTVFLHGCAKKASDEIDFGTVSNSVYRNQYFGLSLTLPPDWSVQDQETHKRLSEAGTKMLIDDDRQARAIAKATEQQTVNLLAAFQHPVGTPVTFNPNVICLAERLRGFPGIKTGKDYHFHARKLMESSAMKIEVADGLSVETLGGVDFDVMHTSMKIAGLTVTQKYHPAVLKGYALVFITSFTAADQQSALQNILQTVSFN